MVKTSVFAVHSLYRLSQVLVKILSSFHANISDGIFRNALNNFLTAIPVSDKKEAMDTLVHEDDVYRTAPTSVPFWAKWFPSLVIYPQFVKIVWQASAKAKREQYDGEAWAKSSLEVIRVLERVGASFEISGLHHVTELEGPCVFIANHMSTLETVTLPAIIQPIKPVTFIVKRSLLEYPVFRHVMRSRDPVAVDRVNPREDLKAVLEGGCARLQQGISIVVFPQTTRTLALDPTQFNTIGAKLAKRAQVPIVPLALCTDAWGNGRWVKEFGRIDPRKKIYYQFGDPLYVQKRGNEEHEAIVAFIMQKLAEWRADVVKRD